MNEPTTPAGRALFTDIDHGDMWHGVTWDDIRAIEAEARQATLAEVRREIESYEDHAIRMESVLAILDRLAEPRP